MATYVYLIFLNTVNLLYLNHKRFVYATKNMLRELLLKLMKRLRRQESPNILVVERKQTSFDRKGWPATKEVNLRVGSLRLQGSRIRLRKPLGFWDHLLTSTFQVARLLYQIDQLTASTASSVDTTHL